MHGFLLYLKYSQVNIYDSLGLKKSSSELVCCLKLVMFAFRSFKEYIRSSEVLSKAVIDLTLFLNNTRTIFTK